MKRRDFLRMATIAMTLTLALTLSGCKKKPKAKTTVIFVNATAQVFDVLATFGTPVRTFNHAAIPIGATAVQTFTTNDAAGAVVPFTGEVTTAGVPAGTLLITGPPFTVTIGKTNVYTFVGDLTDPAAGAHILYQDVK